MKESAITPRRLFTEHYDALCYFAWTMVKDHTLAEDLVQDAFMAYWKHKNEISSEPSAIKSFLYSAIRNAVFNLNRHRKVDERYRRLSPLVEIDETDYEKQIIMAEFMAELKRLVADLPPACQQIFQLSYLDGYSNQQVAEQLSLSVTTVKTQKARALRSIRSRFNPELLSSLSLIGFYLF